MGSATANGYPYPVGTDRVMDGDDAIKALAEAADAKAGITAAGQGSIVGGATTGQLVVTFPAGRFAVAPTAVVGNGKDSSLYLISTSTFTATTFTATGRRYDGGVIGGNISFTWFARS